MNQLQICKALFVNQVETCECCCESNRNKYVYVISCESSIEICKSFQLDICKSLSWINYKYVNFAVNQIGTRISM